MLKIAIIGAGGIARAHLQAYQSLSNLCEVVALCDISQNQLDGFQTQFGLSLPVYLDHKQLLNSVSLDAVSICTPPYVHKEISINALNAGVNVFCEKPMAPSIADCDEMLAAQQRSKKLLSISHQNRFRNDIREVKHVINSGILGEILFARIDSFWWRAHSYYDLWWRGTWKKEGGGCLLNHAVHQVDLMLWFLGKPQSMQALCDNQAHDNSEVEDFATAIIKFQSGCIAQLTGSVICHGEEQQLYFQCEKGKLASPWSLYCSLGQKNGFPKGRDEELERQVLQMRERFSPLIYEYHTGIVANFLNSILGKENLLVTGVEGKNAVEFITLAYQISKDTQQSCYSIDTQHPWYTYEGILQNAPHFYEKTVSLESLEGDVVVGSIQK